MKVKLFLITCFIIFGLQIYHINVEMHDYYKLLYKEKTEYTFYGPSAPRGRILDRNGIVLVDNSVIYNVVYHEPLNMKVEEKINIASSLAGYLNDYSISLKDKKLYFLATNNNGDDLITEYERREYEKRHISREDIERLKWEIRRRKDYLFVFKNE